MTIQEHQKREIQALLADHVKKFKSQRECAKSMINVSEATIIQVKQGHWEGISNTMWINIGKQVGYNTGKWNMAMTKPFKNMVRLLDAAREHSMTIAVAIQAGRGKSYVNGWFENNRPNVFWITCAEYLSSKNLLSKILRRMNKEADGTASDMMEAIIEHVLKMDKPMIILDEFDKLKDKQKLFFITLFNMLSDHCSLAIMGTLNMEYQIRRKNGKHAIGYEEIYSRIGRRFIQLKDSDLKDITQICEANGITDPLTINSIYNEAEGDLRRVKTAVLKERIIKEKETHLENA